GSFVISKHAGPAYLHFPLEVQDCSCSCGIFGAEEARYPVELLTVCCPTDLLVVVTGSLVTAWVVGAHVLYESDKIMYMYAAGIFEYDYSYFPFVSPCSVVCLAGYVLVENWYCSEWWLYSSFGRGNGSWLGE